MLIGAAERFPLGGEGGVTGGLSPLRDSTMLRPGVFWTAVACWRLGRLNSYCRCGVRCFLAVGLAYDVAGWWRHRYAYSYITTLRVFRGVTSGVTCPAYHRRKKGGGGSPTKKSSYMESNAVSKQFLSRISTLARHLHTHLPTTTSIVKISVSHSFPLWAPLMHEASPI